MSVPKNLRTLKTNFEEADGLGIKKNFEKADGLGIRSAVSHLLTTTYSELSNRRAVQSNDFLEKFLT